MTSLFIPIPKRAHRNNVDFLPCGGVSKIEPVK